MSLQLTACGGSGPKPATYASTGAGDAAALSGSLEVNGECVYVKISDGRLVLPAFPRGSVTWKSNRLAFAGRTFQRDQPIELAGSMVASASPLPHFSAPKTCARNLVWAVIVTS